MKFRFRFSNKISIDETLRVVLGVQTFRAYLVLPKDLHYIGVIKFGMEFGLLAQTHSGDYVRVNGSEVEYLCNSKISNAICLARIHMRDEQLAALLAKEDVLYQAHPPTVQIKKSRRIDPNLI